MTAQKKNISYKEVTRIMGLRPKRSHTHMSNTHINYLMAPPFFLIIENNHPTTH